MAFFLIFLFPLLLGLVELNFFEPFDFHHEVLSLLLNFSFLDDFFFLIKLFVSDRDAFGVSDHFVHGFDIIELFIHKFLGSRLKAVLDVFFFLLLLGKRHLLFFLLLHLEHALFLGFGCGLLFLLLLLKDFLLIQLFLFCGDDGIVLGSIEILIATFIR